MSSVYNLEPQPTAKAILHTTSGDITVECWAKQTPLATRNFLQHCLDGYYTNTIFHRIVPNFIIQGGDPTGSGSGGISAINSGDGFANEFHSRLKFNRRGLLGMANEETENSNGSQFFFTLGNTPELQGKNTLFGRVEGDTIYNLMKMAEVELVEGTERPLFPTKITGAEVLVNPFEDMVARVKEAPRVKEDADKKETKKRKKPAGKNVLSFGGDEGDAEIDTPLLKKSKANPKFVSTEEEPIDSKAVKVSTTLPKTRSIQNRENEDDVAPAVEKLDANKAPPPQKSAKSKANAEAIDSDSSSNSEDETHQTALEKTNAEIAALKASMKRNIDAAPKQSNKPKSILETMIPATSTRGRKRGKATDEKGALDMFKAFKQRLEDMPSTTSTTTDSNGIRQNPIDKEVAQSNAVEEDDSNLCDLHFIANCQSCKSWDETDKPDPQAEADSSADATWMAHRLTFAKDTLGKDLEWKRKMEEIEVIDPREKARSIKEERRKKDGERSGKKGRVKDR